MFQNVLSDVVLKTDNVLSFPCIIDVWLLLTLGNEAIKYFYIFDFYFKLVALTLLGMILHLT